MSINLPLVTNRVSTWAALKGKPYITVSANGISNGQSTILNDGADFGPDTMLGATSKDQYGPPYTQTAGIQEAFNYSATSPLYSIDLGHVFYPIKILAGNYNFSTPITYGIGNFPSTDDFSISITGMGYVTTSLTYSGTGNAITINSEINNVYIADFSIDNYPSGTANNLIYWNSTKGINSNVLTVENINNGYSPSSYVMYFNNVFIATIKNVVSGATYVIYIMGTGSNTGFLYMQNQIWNGTYTSIGNFNIAYISGVYNQIVVDESITMLKIINNANVAGVATNATVNSIMIENSVLGITSTPPIIINRNVQYMKLLNNTVSGTSGTLITSLNTGASLTIGTLSIDGLNNIGTQGKFIDVTNITINEYDLKNIPDGTFTNMPTQSSTNGTTAGTVSMNATEYRAKYKKYVITFSGYENDTVTNQTISFPLSFSTSAVISANNTGLTISTTTTGITITAPDNTTTYSGIIIVEGY